MRIAKTPAAVNFIVEKERVLRDCFCPRIVSRRSLGIYVSANS
jgi:hypothetical protein